MTRAEADAKYDEVMRIARSYVAAYPDSFDSKPGYHRVKAELLAMQRVYREVYDNAFYRTPEDLQAVERYHEICAHLPFPHNLAGGDVAMGPVGD